MYLARRARRWTPIPLPAPGVSARAAAAATEPSLTTWHRATCLHGLRAERRRRELPRRQRCRGTDPIGYFEQLRIRNGAHCHHQRAVCQHALRPNNAQVTRAGSTCPPHRSGPDARASALWCACAHALRQRASSRAEPGDHNALRYRVVEARVVSGIQHLHQSAPAQPTAGGLGGGDSPLSPRRQLPERTAGRARAVRPGETYRPLSKSGSPGALESRPPPLLPSRAGTKPVALSANASLAS